MKPIHLFLKQFKGLKAGAGLNEIRLDLSTLPNGLIAITGKNGMGKTTILDNLHPYRLMPYKLREAKEWSPNSFSYYDHTFGEAVKELIFEHGDQIYKSLILIDTDRKKQEAYLFQKVGEAWSPLNDGKTRTYDAAIESVVGSPSLFFSSVFRGQDARKLSSYPRSEILNIVCELLNIDHIKDHGEKARYVAAELSRDMDAILRERDTLQTLVDDADTRIRQELVDNEQLLDVVDSEIADYKAELEALQQKRHDAEIAQAARVEAGKRLAVLLTRKQELEEELASINTTEAVDLAEARAAVKRINDQIDVTDANNKSCSRRLADLQAEIMEIETATAGLPEKVAAAAARLKELDDAAKKAAEATDAKREEAKAMQARSTECRLLDTQIKGAGQVLEDLKQRAAMLDTLDCRADSSSWVNDACPLLVNAVEARDAIAGKAAQIEELEQKRLMVATAEEDLARLNSEGLALKQAQDRAAADLAEAMEEIKGLNELAAKGARLNALKEQIAPVNEQLSTLVTRQYELTDEKAVAEDKLTAITLGTSLKRDRVQQAQAGLLSQITELQQALVNDPALLAGIEESEKLTSRALADKETRRQALIEKVGELKAGLAKSDQYKGKICELMARFTRIGNEQAAWNIITQACSNDGIIQFEIEDAGPVIASIANDLLNACYGPRFSVRIETQAAKSDGGLKETFDITVFDAERDELKSIKDMSGGETCWVEDSITRAIALYNAQQSAAEFGTLFTDEKDGALDSERKTEFLDIKRRAMEVGAHTREFFISQTPELVEMADARIVLAKGGVSIC